MECAEWTAYSSRPFPTVYSNLHKDAYSWDPSSHILHSATRFRMINIFKLLEYMDGCIQLLDYVY
jgi:hypothetical protein